MNREILFRGKRVDNGEWVEGYYVDENCMNLPFDDPDTGTRYFSFVEVDDNTIGQYTGLKAENGVKIFEGDICVVTLFKFDGSNIQCTLTVNYIYGAYILSGDGYIIPMCDINDTESDIKIIGNIHDNPELGGER